MLPALVCHSCIIPLCLLQVDTDTFEMLKTLGMSNLPGVKQVTVGAQHVAAAAGSCDQSCLLIICCSRAQLGSQCGPSHNKRKSMWSKP